MHCFFFLRQHTKFYGTPHKLPQPSFTFNQFGALASSKNLANTGQISFLHNKTLLTLSSHFWYCVFVGHRKSEDVYPCPVMEPHTVRHSNSKRSSCFLILRVPKNVMSPLSLVRWMSYIRCIDNFTWEDFSPLYIRSRRCVLNLQIYNKIRTSDSLTVKSTKVDSNQGTAAVTRQDK
jgi:hypothetical protein